MLKHKKTDSTFCFLFLETSLPICLLSRYSFVETIFKMKLNTLVTKYINYRYFNFKLCTHSTSLVLKITLKKDSHGPSCSCTLTK